MQACGQLCQREGGRDRRAFLGPPKNIGSIPWPCPPKVPSSSPTSLIRVSHPVLSGTSQSAGNILAQRLTLVSGRAGNEHWRRVAPGSRPFLGAPASWVTTHPLSETHSGQGMPFPVLMLCPAVQEVVGGGFSHSANKGPISYSKHCF